MSCTHKDCFTCPYEDCIDDSEPRKLRKKALKQDATEKTKKRREYMQNWYIAHRDEKIEKAMARYWRLKEEQKNDKRRESEGSIGEPEELELECGTAV